VSTAARAPARPALRARGAAPPPAQPSAGTRTRPDGVLRAAGAARRAGRALRPHAGDPAGLRKRRRAPAESAAAAGARAAAGPHAQGVARVAAKAGAGAAELARLQGRPARAGGGGGGGRAARARTAGRPRALRRGPPPPRGAARRGTTREAQQAGVGRAGARVRARSASTHACATLVSLRLPR